MAENNPMIKEDLTFITVKYGIPTKDCEVHIRRKFMDSLPIDVNEYVKDRLGRNIIPPPYETFVTKWNRTRDYAIEALIKFERGEL